MRGGAAQWAASDGPVEGWGRARVGRPLGPGPLRLHVKTKKKISPNSRSARLAVQLTINPNPKKKNYTPIRSVHPCTTIEGH